MKSHFDNPLVEQRDLLAGKRVLEMDDRAVIMVTGADRHEWLNSMLSQKLDRLVVGVSAEALLLDANGHIEQDFQIIEGVDCTWLICLASESAKLMRWFDMVIFRSKVEVADVTAEFSVIGFFGGKLEHKLREAGVEIWLDPWMNDPIGSARYGDAGTREAWNFGLALVPSPSVAGLFAGVGHAGSLAFDALRVAAHRPWQPNELDDKTLPHELDWLASAVHLGKGCYRGQETVAKVHNLGHPPRRLVLLHLDGSADVDPQAGDLVVCGDRELGKVTTFAQHFELGPIALALVSRSADETQDWSVRNSSGVEVAAKAQTIVPASAGAAAGIREKRAGLL